MHRDRLGPGEITRIGSIRATTPLRTAFDVARGLNPTEAVVAVDCLANRYRFAPDLLLNLTARNCGRRGVVQDPATRTALWLDLAWPELMVGIEYEGGVHTEPGRVLRDVSRYTRLVDLGWRVYRYTKFEVHRRRDRITAELTRARPGRPR